MRKIQYLDGLRGLAAFVVVFHHFVYAFYPALFLGSNTRTHLKMGEEVFASGSILNLLYSGNFAVCIFFVMSGFVLSHKFFLQKDHAIIKESAIKRYVRLVVPVAFSVFCAYILMKFSLFYNQQAALVSGSNWLGEFWRFNPNFLDAVRQTFVGAFFSSVFDYNVTLWSIAYEFIGSFIVFGFLAFFGKIEKRYWAYAIAIIFLFQTYYLAFILGMLLSDLMAHQKLFIRKYDKNKLIRTALLLFGLFLGSYPSGRGVDGTMYAFMEKSYLANSAVLYHVIGAFFVILVLLESRKMQRIFSLKYLIFLGEISFAMYLLHFIILGSFSSFVFLKLVQHLPYAAAFLIAFALSIALIFLVSYLVYVYVDKRAVHLSKLVYGLFK
ncbi:MAG: acyltransferase [Candidatus Moranbacteria bacterium]|nr:acyltransferase [Candidatus Moranbacteria bacterium]